SGSGSDLRRLPRERASLYGRRMEREGGRSRGRTGRPEDPILQLERSHRRLGEACDALAAAARDRDLETVSDVCSFFSRQVRRHEQDEERSLFPRLEGPEARDAIERLCREHRAHEALHERLERALSGRLEPAGRDMWSEIASVAS